MLDRLSGQVTFVTLRSRLSAYAAALWGHDITLLDAPPAYADQPRRATITPGMVHVPDVLPGIAPDKAPALYQAMVAHASAHLALGSPRQEPGTLKPLQLALAGLIEDARIEALAMRPFPGLRRLWAPFHIVEPSLLKTAPVLLARVARGLFDPDHRDDDAIVGKARALLFAEPDLEDAGLSRRIGSILGNDIGQMRIQFDPKAFTIEPAYRDDNFGLWMLPPPPPDADTQALDLSVEAARIERSKTTKKQGRAKIAMRSPRLAVAGRPRRATTDASSRTIRSGIARPASNDRTGRRSARSNRHAVMSARSFSCWQRTQGCAGASSV